MFSDFNESEILIIKIVILYIFLVKEFQRNKKIQSSGSTDIQMAMESICKCIYVYISGKCKL